MKFIADENLFEPIIDYLRGLGHDILSIRNAGLSGIADDEVYQLACREKRIIITMDKDFSRILRFPPEKCGGIIVVKIYKRTLDETLKLFEKCFSSLKESDINGNLVIISPESVRIRRSKLKR